MKASLRTGRVRGGLTFVAAIMPEGGSSGKARGHAAVSAAGIFRKTEWTPPSLRGAKRRSIGREFVRSVGSK
jgi:hypothetical protein